MSLWNMPVEHLAPVKAERDQFMTQSQERSERAEFISKALREASELVESLNEKYREQAFPIVLRGLIDEGIPTKTASPVASDRHIETPSSESSTPLLPQLSVNEFFHTVNLVSHVGRFVSAAYYLLRYKQVEQFSMVDILDIYTKLRLKKPQNHADTLNQCIRKAHIIDAPSVNGQKRWVITPAGEKYVEELIHASANAKKSAS